MEKIDEGMEKRVWQRVHGASPGASLQSMAAAEQNLAAVYLMLSRMNQSANRQLLRQLYERERSHGWCLNGISRIRDDQTLKLQPLQPAGDRMEVALRKCYAQTLRSMQVYRQMESDGEFGHIFRHLRQQEEENCALILQAIGR